MGSIAQNRPRTPLSGWDSGFFSSCSQSYESSQSFEPWGTDSQLIPQPSKLVNLFIEEKSDYFRKLCSNIMEIKENYNKNVAKIINSIDEMTRQITFKAHFRNQELKARLHNITDAKMVEWDRQLDICKDAQQWLIQIAHSAITPSDELDSICNSLFTKKLDFVDAGDIKFEVADFSVLNVLQNLGRITCSTGSNMLDKETNVRRVSPKFIIGSGGQDEGQFCRPWGVCTDATGRILVADRSNHRIQIFSESGKFLLQFGKEGSRAGEFSRPAGIAVDKKQRIIVSDKDNHRIQVFTSNGAFLFTFGRQGTMAGEFTYPWDVAVNDNCGIAVSDSKNHRVQLFNEQGVFLAKIGYGRCRAELKELDCPRGLSFMTDGRLLVTDFNNHRIVVINKTFTALTHFGREGQRLGEFCRPQGIACHKSGMFAVADGKNYRIQVFNECGNQWKLHKVFGSQGNIPGQFNGPQGICFHPNGNIIVVDFGNERVQVF